MDIVRTRFPVLCAALLASVLLPGAAAGGAAPPAVSIQAPPDGSTQPPGNAVGIGGVGAGGPDRVELEVNGKAVQALESAKGGFKARVTLLPGRNVIRATAGSRLAEVSVTASGKGGYRYHPDIEKCAKCHGEGLKGYSLAGSTEAVCYRCHGRKDRGKNIHGPLGGGDCTACHDPHGSVYASLTVAGTEKLCAACHDQQSSERHFKEARGKACSGCHEPHSSDKPFLQR